MGDSLVQKRDKQTLMPHLTETVMFDIALLTVNIIQVSSFLEELAKKIRKLEKLAQSYFISKCV